jgi:putative Mg2+ transporter-C (MgtC) family protein
MVSLSSPYLASFWSQPMVEVNLVVFLYLAGSLALGMLLGYERSYHGRAAGMRTYGIVCMASTALTVFCGYPGFWWGVGAHSPLPVDPSRVVQGIVTGVGFLGAGVIMKEGLNISGLTTAASIWASCAIGVLVGVGFFAAAMMLTLLLLALMLWAPKLEMRLPSRRAMGVVVAFKPGFEPHESTLKSTIREWGYMVAEGSLNISADQHAVQWNFVMVALRNRPEPNSLFELSRKLREVDGVDSLQISHARN